MALLMGITIPAGLEIIYNKTLKMYDISVLCNVGKNPRFLTRKQKLTLKEVTYLFQIAYAWSFFTTEEKAVWTAAGDIVGQNGYNLYVQDKSWRIKHAIGGNAVPSIYHQYLIGNIHVADPANYALVTQYNATRVNFPATFQLSRKSNLTATGPNPYCHVNFIWTRYYQGQNILNYEVIDIPLVSDWATQIQTITSKIGIRGRWQIEIELNDVTGDLWFDNIYPFYSGEAKINDPFCDEVEKYWEPTIMPDGSTISTQYPQGGAI
ncbi:MAG: hypothetical protein WCX48_08770 [Bacteroidales bacterium]|jgi:hypothetical protein